MLLSILKLVRYKNLLLIVLTQALIKYALFEPFGIAITLSDLGFFLLCLATVSIAAAGSIINDLETQRINRPEKPLLRKQVSEKTAFTAYIVLSILGVGIGFYLSNLIGRPGFSAIFIIISALLYLYATYLKNVLIIGNLVISSLVAMVIILMGLFDLLPAVTPGNKLTQSIIFSILLDYALFAFLIHWLREMIKDQRDMNGDYNTGRNSLTITLGKERTNKFIFLIGLIPLILILFYTYDYLFENSYAVLYALLLILAPLLYFLIQLLSAKTKKRFSNLNGILKVILLTGLFSIGFYQFILL